MSDPNQENWLMGAMASLLGSISVYFYRKVDSQEKRLNRIPETYVTRTDLAALEARIEARALAAENRGTSQHSDNTNNFREVRLQLESVNSKLFDLASK